MCGRIEKVTVGAPWVGEWSIVLVYQIAVSVYVTDHCKQVLQVIDLKVFEFKSFQI